MDRRIQSNTISRGKCIVCLFVCNITLHEISLVLLRKQQVIIPAGGGGEDFLMSGIRVCATNQGLFFTSKNPELAPNFEVFLQNRS